jgi:hypothetical protein
MIEWDDDVDLDCPGCECCTEDECGESAQCIASQCRCFTDQPDRPSEDDDG